MEPVDLGMGAAIVWGIIRHIGRWKVITFLLHFRPVHYMYTGKTLPWAGGASHDVTFSRGADSGLRGPSLSQEGEGARP